MLALQTGLMGLQHKKVWRVSKPICLTALMLQGTLVATSFPPGALVVSSMPYVSKSIRTVPTWNPSFRGANNSVREMTNHALFQMWYGDAYRSPRFSLNKLVKANIHGGQYTPTTSPCGSNCTYEVTIQGSAFECKEGITSDLRTLTTEYYGNKSTTPPTTTEFNPKLVNYLAAMNGSALYHNSSAIFEIQYANGTFCAYEVPPLSSLSCTAWYADYTFEISYSNGVQSVVTQVNKTSVITSAVLSALSLSQKDNGSSFSDDHILSSGYALGQAYRDTNIYAILDSVTSALSGAVSGYGNEALFVSNTMILESSMAQYTPSTHIYADGYTPADTLSATLKISPATMQNVLENVMISLLSIANAETSTSVQTTTYFTTYSFASRYKQLVLPYALALGLSLVLVVYAIYATIKCSGLPRKERVVDVLRVVSRKDNQGVIDRARDAPFETSETLKEAVRKLKNEKIQV
ncbi:hypothetical protein ABEW05_001360 [Botrytis cinerea]